MPLVSSPHARSFARATRCRFEIVNRRSVLVGGGAAALAGAAVAIVGIDRADAMDAYAAAVARTRGALDADPGMIDLVRFATLAPSGHNTQPWRFRLTADRMTILPDLKRRTPVVDPDDHHLFVALGCAAETLAIAAAARGHPGQITFDPTEGGAASFVFGGARRPEPALFAAIARRRSSRTVYDGRPLANTDLSALAQAAAMPGVDLMLLTDRPRVDHVRDLVIAGNSAQLASDAFMRELKHWIRFSPHHALQTGDGLFAASSGSPALPEWPGPGMFDATFHAKSENNKYARQLGSSAGIAVFVGHAADAETWIAVGRAAQRFQLQATALGIAHAFVNQPVEVARLRPELATLIGLPGRRPDLVLRFGHGPTLPYSARRAVSAVLV